MDDDEYDPETCWTAGELRARGVRIEESVPDVAWVPKWAVVPREVTDIYSDGKDLHVKVALDTLAPFRWVHFEFEEVVNEQPKG